MAKMQYHDRWFRIRGGAALGAALADCRQAAGLTQVELAERLGTSRDTILRLESAPNSVVDRAVRAFGAVGYELMAVPRGSVVRVEPAGGRDEPA